MTSPAESQTIYLVTFYIFDTFDISYTFDMFDVSYTFYTSDTSDTSNIFDIFKDSSCGWFMLLPW